MQIRLYILLTVVQVALCQRATTFRNKLPNSWNNCEKDVCDEVKDQTEGLIRLKLMKSYITETMNLLTQLVTSMDAEMVESGKKLSEFIGPSCPSVHPLLKQVTEHTMKDLEFARDAGLSSAMSLGVELHDDDSLENPYDSYDGTIGNDNYGQNSNSQAVYSSTSSGYVAPSTPKQPIRNNYGSKYGGKTHNFDDDDDDSDEQYNTNYSTGQQWRPSHVISTKQPKSLDYQIRDHHTQTDFGTRRPTSNGHSGSRPTSNAHIGSRPTSNTHIGSRPTSNTHIGSRPVYNTKSESNPTTQKGYNDNTSDKITSATNTQPIVSGPKDRSKCRGVPRGSPSWVPGLDSWCQQICPQGYCPETHCVC